MTRVTHALVAVTTLDGCAVGLSYVVKATPSAEVITELSVENDQYAFLDAGDSGVSVGNTCVSDNPDAVGALHDRDDVLMGPRVVSRLSRTAISSARQNER